MARFNGLRDFLTESITYVPDLALVYDLETDYARKVEVYRWIREDETLRNANTTIQSFYDTTVISNLELFEQVTDLMNQGGAINHMLASQINNSIVPTNLQQTLLKRVNQLKCQCTCFGSTSITCNDSLDLATCPLEGGEAVYQARIERLLLRHTTSVDYPSLCNFGNNLPKISNNMEKSFIKPD